MFVASQPNLCGFWARRVVRTSNNEKRELQAFRIVSPEAPGAQHVRCLQAQLSETIGSYTEAAVQIPAKRLGELRF